MPFSQKNQGLRAIALATVFAFAITTVGGDFAWAVSGVETAPVRISESPLGNLPPALGRVLTYQTSRGDNAPFILHIQDAHSNPSAQKNIAKLLEWISSQSQNTPPLIALEGLKGPLHPEYLNFFSGHPKVNQALVQQLVDKGELTGAELFAWKISRTAPSVKRPASRGIEEAKPVFFGVEEPALYRENLAIYREFLDQEPEIKTALEILRRQLYQRENNTLSKEARAYLREKRHRKEGDYQTGHSNPQWEAYLGYLKKTLKEKAALDLEAPFEQIRFPNTVRLDVLMRAFKDLDFEKAVQEKDLFLNTLETKLRSAQDKQTLQLFKEASGAKNLRDLAEQVWVLALNYRLDPKRFAAFWSLTGRDILETELEVAGLDEEMHQLEKWLEDVLAPSAEDKIIFKLGHDFDLLEKTLSLELTAERVTGREKEEKTIPEFQNVFEMAQTENAEKILRPWIEKARRFYELAIERDKILLDNTLQAARGQKAAVLITGGFHTEGFTALMRDREIGYAVIQPKMEVTGEDFYQKVLRGENADVSAYFENPFLNKQEALFFKTIVETGAAELWEKDKVPHQEIAAEAAEALRVHPVLKDRLEARAVPEGKQGSRLELHKVEARPLELTRALSQDVQAVVSTLVTNGQLSFEELASRRTHSERLAINATVSYQPVGTAVTAVLVQPRFPSRRKAGRSEVRSKTADWAGEMAQVMGVSFPDKTGPGLLAGFQAIQQRLQASPADNADAMIIPAENLKRAAVLLSAHAVQHSNAEVALSALETLALMGQEALNQEPVLTSALRILNDRSLLDSRRRVLALRVIWAAQPRPKKIVSALIAILKVKDEAEDLKIEALHTLALWGDKADSAEAAIAKLIMAADSSAPVREAATAALNAIAPEKLAELKHEKLREAGLPRSERGPSSGTPLTANKPVFQSISEAMQALSIKGMDYAPNARVARDYLAAQPASPELDQALITLIQNGESARATRVFAMAVLAESAVDLAAGRKIIFDLLKHSSTPENLIKPAMETFFILGLKIDSTQPSFYQDTLFFLQSPNAEVQKTILRKLQENSEKQMRVLISQPQMKELIDQIIYLLSTSPTKLVRHEAANLLGRYAPSFHEVSVPALLQVLNDNNYLLVKPIARSLGAFGGHAVSAREALETAFIHSRGRVDIETVISQALNKINAGKRSEVRSAAAADTAIAETAVKSSTRNSSLSPVEAVLPQPDFSAFREKHYVLLDDKAFILQGYETLLRERGLTQLVSADSPQAGLAAIQQLRAAGISDADIVVISDYQFSGEKTVLDVINSLRVPETGPVFSGPILLVSGSIVSRHQIPGFKGGKMDPAVAQAYGLSYLEKNGSFYFREQFLATLHETLKAPPAKALFLKEKLEAKAEVEITAVPEQLVYLESAVNDWENAIAGFIQSFQNQALNHPERVKIQTHLRELSRLIEFGQIDRNLSFERRVHDYKSALHQASAIHLRELQELVIVSPGMSDDANLTGALMDLEHAVSAAFQNAYFLQQLFFSLRGLEKLKLMEPLFQQAVTEYQIRYEGKQDAAWDPDTGIAQALAGLDLLHQAMHRSEIEKALLAWGRLRNDYKSVQDGMDPEILQAAGPLRSAMLEVLSGALNRFFGMYLALYGVSGLEAGEPGQAVGTVRILRGTEDEIRAAMEGLQEGQIVVLDQDYSTLSVAGENQAGILFSREGAGHLATRARTLGIPLVYLPNAVEMLTDGMPLMLLSEKGKGRLRPATSAELADRKVLKTSRRKVEPAPVNFDSPPLLNMNYMLNEDAYPTENVTVMASFLGPKGARSFVMSRDSAQSGAVVPSTLFLTFNFYKTLLEHQPEKASQISHLQQEIAQITAAGDTALKLDSLRTKLAALRGLIEQLEIPDEQRHELLKMGQRERNAWKPKLIIRLTTNTEDLENDPGVGAGVHDSHEVEASQTNEEYLRLVLKSLASFWSWEAFSDRRFHGIDETAAHPALMVQHYESGAQYAALVHTADPTSQNSEVMMIELMPGTGRVLTSPDPKFQGEPYRFFFDKKTGEVIRAEDVRQAYRPVKASKRYTQDPKTGEVVPTNYERDPLLASEEKLYALVREIALKAQKNEQYFNRPMDLEMTIEIMPQTVQDHPDYDPEDVITGLSTVQARPQAHFAPFEGSYQYDLETQSRIAGIQSWVDQWNLEALRDLEFYLGEEFEKLPAGTVAESPQQADGFFTHFQALADSTHEMVKTIGILMREPQFESVREGILRRLFFYAKWNHGVLLRVMRELQVEQPEIFYEALPYMIPPLRLNEPELRGYHKAWAAGVHEYLVGRFLRKTGDSTASEFAGHLSSQDLAYLINQVHRAGSFIGGYKYKILEALARVLAARPDYESVKDIVDYRLTAIDLKDIFKPSPPEGRSEMRVLNVDVEGGHPVRNLLDQLEETWFPLRELDRGESGRWAIKDGSGTVVAGAERTRLEHVRVDAESMDALLRGDLDAFQTLDVYAQVDDQTLAPLIQMIQNLDPFFQRVLVLANALHDAGYRDLPQDRSHQLLGAERAEAFLRGSTEEDLTIALVTEAVRAHSDLWVLANRSGPLTQRGRPLLERRGHEGLIAWAQSLAESGLIARDQLPGLLEKFKVVLTAMTVSDVHSAGDRHLTHESLQNIFSAADQAFSVLPEELNGPSRKRLQIAARSNNHGAATNPLDAFNTAMGFTQIGQEAFTSFAVAETLQQLFELYRRMDSVNKTFSVQHDLTAFRDLESLLAEKEVWERRVKFVRDELAGLEGRMDTKQVKAVEYLKKAEISAGIIWEIVENRVLFARGTPEKQRLNLADVLKKAATGSEWRSGIKVHEKVQLTITEDDLEIEGDPLSLINAFYNVMQNAEEALRDFPESKVTVTARREGQKAVIEISDPGPGITAANLERVFNLGFSTKGEGRGLGLAETRYVLEEDHQGTITGVSTPGQLTRFTITLPLATLPAASPDLLVEAAKRSEMRSTNTGAEERIKAAVQKWLGSGTVGFKDVLEATVLQLMAPESRLTALETLIKVQANTPALNKKQRERRDTLARALAAVITQASEEPFLSLRKRSLSVRIPAALMRKWADIFSAAHLQRWADGTGDYPFPYAALGDYASVFKAIANEKPTAEDDYLIAGFSQRQLGEGSIGWNSAGQLQSLAEARLLRIRGGAAMPLYAGLGWFETQPDAVIPFMGGFYRQDGTEISADELRAAGLEWVQDSKGQDLKFPVFTTTSIPSRVAMVPLPPSRVRLVFDQNEFRLLSTKEDLENFITEKFGTDSFEAIQQEADDFIRRTPVKGETPSEAVLEEFKKKAYVMAMMSFLNGQGHKYAMPIVALRYKGIGNYYNFQPAVASEFHEQHDDHQLEVPQAEHGINLPYGWTVVKDERLAGKSGVFLFPYQKGSLTAMGAESAEVLQAMENDRILFFNGATLSTVTVGAVEVASEKTLRQWGVATGVNPLYAAVQVVTDDTRNLMEVLNLFDIYLKTEIDKDPVAAQKKYLENFSSNFGQNIAGIVKSNLTFAANDLSVLENSGMVRNISPLGNLRDTGELQPVKRPQESMRVILSMLNTAFYVTERGGLSSRAWAHSPYFDEMLTAFIQAFNGSEALREQTQSKIANFKKMLSRDNDKNPRARLAFIVAVTRTLYEYWTKAKGVSNIDELDSELLEHIDGDPDEPLLERLSFPAADTNFEGFVAVGRPAKSPKNKKARRSEMRSMSFAGAEGALDTPELTEWLGVSLPEQVFREHAFETKRLHAQTAEAKTADDLDEALGRLTPAESHTSLLVAKRFSGDSGLEDHAILNYGIYQQQEAPELFITGGRFFVQRPLKHQGLIPLMVLWILNQHREQFQVLNVGRVEGRIPLGNQPNVKLAYLLRDLGILDLTIDLQRSTVQGAIDWEQVGLLTESSERRQSFARSAARRELLDEDLRRNLKLIPVSPSAKAGTSEHAAWQLTLGTDSLQVKDFNALERFLLTAGYQIAPEDVVDMKQWEQAHEGLPVLDMANPAANLMSAESIYGAIETAVRRSTLIGGVGYNEFWSRSQLFFDPAQVLQESDWDYARDRMSTEQLFQLEARLLAQIQLYEIFSEEPSETEKFIEILTERVDQLRQIRALRSEMRITQTGGIHEALEKSTSALVWLNLLTESQPADTEDKINVTLQIARGIQMRVPMLRSVLTNPELQESAYRYLAVWAYNLSIIFGTSFVAVGAADEPTLIDADRIKNLLTQGGLSNIRESLTKRHKNPLGIKNYANAGKEIEIKPLDQLTAAEKEVTPVALDIQLLTKVQGAYLGIDVGGGSAKMTVIQNGTVVHLPDRLRTIPTVLYEGKKKVFESPEKYMQRMRDRVEAILSYLSRTYAIEKLEGVGINTPGAADFAANRMETLGQIPVKKKWSQGQTQQVGRELPLHIANILGLPAGHVKIRNDMDGVLPGVASVLARVKADFWNRTKGNFAFDWMGTGHGFQFALGGVPMNAPTEAGHMIEDFGSEGQKIFDTEAYTSIPSMLRWARQLARGQKVVWKRIQGDKLKPLADAVFYTGSNKNALKKKAIAQKVFERFAQKYAANLALRYHMSQATGQGSAAEILLGGGIARGKTGEFLKTLTMRALAEHGLDSKINITVITDDEIRSAGVDPDDVGPIGAAYFIQSALEGRAAAVIEQKEREEWTVLAKRLVVSEGAAEVLPQLGAEPAQMQAVYEHLLRFGGPIQKLLFKLRDLNPSVFQLTPITFHVANNLQSYEPQWLSGEQVIYLKVSPLIFIEEQGGAVVTQKQSMEALQTKAQNVLTASLGSVLTRSSVNSQVRQIAESRDGYAANIPLIEGQRLNLVDLSSVTAAFLNAQEYRDLIQAGAPETALDVFSSFKKHEGDNWPVQQLLPQWHGEHEGLFQDEAHSYLGIMNHLVYIAPFRHTAYFDGMVSELKTIFPAGRVDKALEYAQTVSSIRDVMFSEKPVTLDQITRDFLMPAYRLLGREILRAQIAERISAEDAEQIEWNGLSPLFDQMVSAAVQGKAPGLDFSNAVVTPFRNQQALEPVLLSEWNSRRPEQRDRLKISGLSLLARSEIRGTVPNLRLRASVWLRGWSDPEFAAIPGKGNVPAKFIARIIYELFGAGGLWVFNRLVNLLADRIAGIDNGSVRSLRRERQRIQRLAMQNEDAAIDVFDRLVKKNTALSEEDALAYFGQFLSVLGDVYLGVKAADPQKIAAQGYRSYLALTEFRQDGKNIVKGMPKSDQSVYEGFPANRTEVLVVTKDSPGLIEAITEVLHANLVRNWTLSPVSDSAQGVMVLFFEVTRNAQELTPNTSEEVVRAIQAKLDETANLRSEIILEGGKINQKGTFSGFLSKLQGFGYGISDVVYDVNAGLNNAQLTPAQRERAMASRAREDNERFRHVIEDRVLPMLQALPAMLGIKINAETPAAIEKARQFVVEIEREVLKEVEVQRLYGDVRQFRRSALSRFLKHVQLKGPASGLPAEVIKKIDKVVLNALRESNAIFDPGQVVGEGQRNLVQAQQERLRRATEQVLPNLEAAATNTTRMVYEMTRLLLLQSEEDISRRNITAEEAVTRNALKVIRDLQLTGGEKAHANADDYQNVFTMILLALVGQLEDSRGEVMVVEQGADIILFARNVSVPKLEKRLKEFAGRIKVIITDDAVGKDTHWIQMADNDFGVPTLILPKSSLKSVWNADLFGEEVVVNAEEGRVYIRPTAETKRRLEQEGVLYKAIQQVALEQAHEPARTLGGQTLEARASAERTESLQQAMEQGASGAGLVRTEYLMNMDIPEIRDWFSDPSPENRERLVAYFAVHFQDITESIRLADPSQPVTLRTFDLERDKKQGLPNSLGQFGPAFYATPQGRELLKLEILGMLRAGLKYPEQLRVMFPAFRHPIDLKTFLETDSLEGLSESDQERLNAQTRTDIDLMNAVLDEAIEEMSAKSPEAREALKKVRRGFMIETIEGLNILEHVLERADFISVGSTDLTISLNRALADISRDNPLYADKFSELQPSFFEAVRHILDTVSRWNARHGRDVGVDLCGGLPSVDTVVAGILAAKPENVTVGLSLSPQKIAVTKFWIRHLERGADNQAEAAELISQVWKKIKALPEVQRALEQIQAESNARPAEPVEEALDEARFERGGAIVGDTDSTQPLLLQGYSMETRGYRLGIKGFHTAPAPTIITALKAFPKVQIHLLFRNGSESRDMHQVLQLMGLILAPNSMVQVRVVGPEQEVPEVFRVLETLGDVAANNAPIFLPALPDEAGSVTEIDGPVLSMPEGPTPNQLRKSLFADEVVIFKEPNERGLLVFTWQQGDLQRRFVIHPNRIAVFELGADGQKLVQNILEADEDYLNISLILSDPDESGLTIQQRSEVRRALLTSEVMALRLSELQTILTLNPSTASTESASLAALERWGIEPTPFSDETHSLAERAGFIYGSPENIAERLNLSVLEVYGRLIRLLAESAGEDETRIAQVRDLVARHLGEYAKVLEGSADANYQYLDLVDVAELNEDTAYALALLSLVRPRGDQIRLYLSGEDVAVRERMAFVTEAYNRILAKLGGVGRANLTIINVSQNVSQLDTEAIQKDMRAFATGKNGKLQAAILSAHADFLNGFQVMRNVRRMNRGQVNRAQALLASPALLAAQDLDERTFDVLQMREELERLGLGALLSERFTQMMAEIKLLAASA